MPLRWHFCRHLGALILFCALLGSIGRGQAQAPTFLTQPQGFTNGAGETVVFAASVAGTAPLAYRWQKFDANLSDTTRRTGTASNSLTLVGTLPADAGDYRLIVTNFSGAATSAVATLTVLLPESITFPDPALEATLREALNTPTGAIIPGDLASLTTLSACGRSLSNLSGLEWATNLTSLSLCFNAITNLTPLDGLTRLTQLTLENNQVEDLTPLAGLEQLNTLNAGDNRISNISPLTSLSNLTSLSLHRNPLGNLSPVTNLSALTSLTLFSSGITDLSPLAGLSGLNYLELRWNPLTNAAAVLSGLTNLRTLYLGGSGIESIHFLTNHAQLSFLNLDNDTVPDPSALSSLPGLRELDLSYNPLMNPAALVTLTNLESLHLSGNSISDAGMFTNLSQLRILTLQGNQITNPAPLGTLTNLSALNLGNNPLTSWADPDTFTNLACLCLDNISFTNLDFIQGLPALEAIGLRSCQQSKLPPVAGLTNLVVVIADNNRITNIDELPALNRLARVQLTGNLLDLSASSPPAIVVDTLRNRGAAVIVSPQNQPPEITIPATWSITTNQPASLLFSIRDDLTPAAELTVTATPLDPNLLPTSAVSATATPDYRLLKVTPAANQTGTGSIQLRVTDAAGISSTTTLTVTVLAPVPSVLTDTNLTQSIAWTLGSPANNFSSLALADLNQLIVNAGTIKSLAGLQWAVNLTNLEFTATSITNLAPLQTLTKLQSLTIRSSSLLNGSALAGMSNLTRLTLEASALTNLDFLQNLPQLTQLSLTTRTVKNFQALASLTNLTTLQLPDHSPGDSSLFTGLTRLVSLNIAGCRIANAAPLATLTNLQVLKLQRNRLADISPLTNLLKLAVLDISYNQINTSGNTALQTLLGRGVSVNYLPQRSQPVLDTPSTWFAAANATSYLRCSSFEVGSSIDEYPTLSILSTNPALVTNTHLFISQDLPTFPNNWVLTLSPPADFTGTNVFTVVATSELGLATTNTITLTLVQPLPIDAPLLNATNLTWQTGGHAPWFGQTRTTHDGISAAQSGSIDDAQESWIQTTVNGPRQLSFWWKVSSEATYDYLEFYTNNVRLAQRPTGDQDWTQFTLNIPAGTQTLRWRYFKDDGFSDGEDAAWLDEITLKTPATLVITNLSQVYDGKAHPVGVVTSPAGLSVGLTYNNSPNPPTNTGTYQVVATLNDPNYYGTVTNTLVILPEAPFVILSLTGAGTTNAVVTWTSVSNRVYELHYQSVFGGAWLPVATDIIATNTITFATDTSGASDQRFYRVMQVAPPIYTNGPPVILSLTNPGTAEARLTWSAISNINYRVYYARSLGASWIALTPDVRATNTTASATDPTPGVTQRFYRVMVVWP